MGSRCDCLGDFREAQVHCLGIAGGQDQSHAPCPVSGRWRRRYRSMRFADPAERSGECRASPTDLVLLADTSLVLEPNFYLADVDRLFARDFIQARWELFLKSSMAPSACA
jgi:hypothetical protein